MEENINIAEILKYKPENTKLYSPLFGDVYFSYVQDSIINVKHHAGESKFLNSGRYYNYDESELLLFPSKEMRDWSKFSWEKGDVLVSRDGGTEVVFDKWYDDTYTSFYCKYYLNSEDEYKIVYYDAFLCTTERYSLEDKDSVQTYINTIEKRLGIKLNRETLNIDKQTEFKDGDIVCMMDRFDNYRFIFIYRNEDDENFYYHAHITRKGFVNLGENEYLSKPRNYSIHLATDLEKQQLFDALAKKGNAWDAEKKMIVDLKKKVELKPFDKVVVRNTEYSTWCADFFSHIDVDYRYACVGATWSFCIPYNEETAKLIGTTNNVEG